MLYKKYVIELTCDITVINDVTLNTTSMYNNQFQIDLSPTIKNINVIKFLNKNGYIEDYETIYETYQEAFDVLSTYYYDISSGYNIITKKIVEVYNDVTPPIEVLRSIKLKKIIK